MILSVSQPMVSAMPALLVLHRLDREFIDLFNQVVSFLVEPVDAAFGLDHVAVQRRTRVVFLAPELGVNLGQLADQVSQHGFWRQLQLLPASKTGRACFKSPSIFWVTISVLMFS